MTEQISVNLANDIIYVYGIVNDVEVSFELVEIGVWSAVVDKAEDGRYVVSITAYNSLGTQTEYNTTIYKLGGLIPPKMNWARYDYYNAADLVRVEANTQYIADMLIDMGYIPDVGAIKADWEMTDFPYLSEIKRVDINIDELKNCFYAPDGWENKKDWDTNKTFSYVDANRFEKNLYLLDYIIELLKDGTIYSGTFYSGQDVIL